MQIVIMDKPHEFVQTNEEKKETKDGHPFDEYKCVKCGLKGKRYGENSHLNIPGKDKTELIENCTGIGNPIIPQVIEVTRPNMQLISPRFNNLTLGSVHNVITPPAPHKNSMKGVWVMAKSGVETMLFSGEFKKAKRKRTKFGRFVRTKYQNYEYYRN